MELKTAKRKGLAQPCNTRLFPNLTDGICTGIYVGHCCYVQSTSEMMNLYNMGFYGTGTLSRSEPTFGTVSELPEIILEQQFRNRRSFKPDEVIDNLQVIINHSTADLHYNTVAAFLNRAQLNAYDSLKKTKGISPPSINNYVMQNFMQSSDSNDHVGGSLAQMINGILAKGKVLKKEHASTKSVVIVGPEGSKEVEAPPQHKEKFVLDLQEAFYLSAALGILKIVDSTHTPMSLSDLWTAFRNTEKSFVQKYMVYHWYRSKGWIVRSGLKQGGDFVLYEKGPPYCHSSYVVRVREVNNTLKWVDLAGLQRLVETFKKDILLCYVVPSKYSDLDTEMGFELIKNYRIAEVMWRRWTPSQQKLPK